MSSDSSEDETLDRLREAVDNEFLNNDMFEPKKRKDDKPHISKPSLRYQDKEENLMGVTEGFQKYVGGQLMKFLDSQIKEVDISSKTCQIKKDTEGGIRLFGASLNTVSCDDDVEDEGASRPQKRTKWKCKVNGENISEKKQCKEVAVPAEWILSKEAVAGWEPSTKGKLEIYSADDVIIKCKKMKNKTDNLQVLTPEDKAEKKKLKRKKCRERLKNKSICENESLNI
ncbi:Uncharacterized protein GBIM_09727 [Gryllus bimaculatus]|nr:Uncharacterized protein GBIM_09727 [Gryllus bimaculatus]